MATLTKQRKNGVAIESAEGLQLLQEALRQCLWEIKDQQLRDIAELIRQLAMAKDQETREEIMETVAEMLFPKLIGETVPLTAFEDVQARKRLEEYRQKVGSEIRKHRQQLGLTQQALAEKAGIPQSHVSRLERGKHAPTYKTIKQIADALHTTPAMLDPGFSHD